MRKIAKHLPHYLPLMGILFAGAVGFFLFSYDITFQIGTVVAVSVSYVVWGIIHHAIHRDLYLVVVIEYLVIASLGLVIVFSLIFRA